MHGLYFVLYSSFHYRSLRENAIREEEKEGKYSTCLGQLTKRRWRKSFPLEMTSCRDTEEEKNLHSALFFLAIFQMFYLSLHIRFSTVNPLEATSSASWKSKLTLYVSSCNFFKISVFVVCCSLCLLVRSANCCFLVVVVGSSFSVFTRARATSDWWSRRPLGGGGRLEDGGKERACGHAIVLYEVYAWAGERLCHCAELVGGCGTDRRPICWA